MPFCLPAQQNFATRSPWSGEQPAPLFQGTHDMATITIDGTDYDADTLNDEVKAQLLSLQAVDRRIANLQEELAILQTARNAYGLAAKAALDA